MGKARLVIETEIDGLRRMSGLLGEGFVEAVGMLQDTLNRRGKIVVVGVGKSGNIGHKIAATLNSTGATAVVMDSQNALHGDLGLLSDGMRYLRCPIQGRPVNCLICCRLSNAST